MFLVISFCFLTMGVYSISKEKRRFRNGVYLILSLLFFAVGSLLMMSDYNLEVANLIALFIILIGFIIIIIMIGSLFWDTYLMCKKEGNQLTSYLPAGFACLIIFFIIFGFGVLLGVTHNIWLNAIIVYGFTILFYLAFFFWAFWLYSFAYSIFPKQVHCDYIIIHGAGLINGSQISPLLAGRIDHAISLYELGNHKAKIIASGGKGDDETISEGAAIQQYLLIKQISINDIIVEDQSTTTYENLVFSKQIMERLSNSYTCLFVTNNYHLFRTSMYAKKLGIKGEGAGVKIAKYYWPSAFIREYIALLVHFKWALIIWMIVWFIFIMISMLPVNLF